MTTALPASCRILEGVVTTVSDVALLDRRDAVSLAAINIAPMGPIVDAGFTRLILRPFTSSTTYRNLKATGQGVFHITDDALLIARGAIGKVAARWSDAEAGDAAAVRLADVVRGVVLTGACRYYEFRVESLDDSQERTRIEARVVHRGVLREFLGFNRAKHAVLEAAILATRLHLTGAASVLAEFDRLLPPIEKTGGDEEHQAMRELRAFVEAKGRGADAPATAGYRVGDRVVRNEKTWISDEFDEWGRGVGIGEVVEPPFPLETGYVDVRWPAGRCIEPIAQLLPAAGS